METIHLKTVDPISQDLLRSATQKGFLLNWERYERLQPQDGFLRLGLSCPYGCMQGPCRIDPFGRGPQTGICGMQKDQMVGAMILRIVLQGVLEICNGQIPSLSTPDDGLTRSVWPHFDGSPVSIRDIYQSIIHLGSRQSGAENNLLQAFRLGLLALELLDEKDSISPKSGTLRAGYGVIAGSGALIGVLGYPDSDFLESVVVEMEESTSTAVQIISLGDWITLDQQYVPIACTTGEAELLISSGYIDLLVAGAGVESGLLDVCRQAETPVIQTGDVDGIDKKVKAAISHTGKHKGEAFMPDSSLVGEGVVADLDILQGNLSQIEEQPIILVGGADNLHLPLGWIPVELSKALSGDEKIVAAWGDAALWMIKDGLTGKDYPSAPLIVDPYIGPIQVVRTMQTTKTLKYLRGVCFTGLKSCTDFSLAIGLAGLGLDVCVAAPIPIWGSKSVREELTELLSMSGGSLRYFDEAPHAQDLLDWFKER